MPARDDLGAFGARSLGIGIDSADDDPVGSDGVSARASAPPGAGTSANCLGDLALSMFVGGPELGPGTVSSPQAVSHSTARRGARGRAPLAAISGEFLARRRDE